jgi:hypothetical protein
MKHNKLVIPILVFILLVSSVYAECPPDCGSSGSDYDYGSDDSYSDPDFYSNSDPSQWDYSKVDWEKVDFNRVELYSSSEFYNNIPDERYGDLDYQQVDYSQIQDHNKIDSAKYFQDIGCTSCSLNRGNQNLVFSKTGITHPNGNSVSIPGTYPSGSLFVATEDRIEVIVPQDTATVDIPTGDSVTLNTRGRDITLSDGTKVNGKLSYDNNQAFVKEGDKAVINNVEVFAAYNNVNVFHDGSEHEGNYVSFGDKNIIIQGDNFDVRFKEGNQYVNVNSAENDRFIVSPKNNGKVSITNHDTEGKAPEVIVTGNDDVTEWARIINGKFDSILGNEGVMKLNANEALQSEFGSVPMEIKIFDEEGNSLILGENGEEGKIAINNDNKLNYCTMNSLVDINGISTCGSGSNPSSITGMVIYEFCDSLFGTSYSVSEAERYRNYLINNYGQNTEFKINFVGIESWSREELETVSKHLHKLWVMSPEIVKNLGSVMVTDKLPRKTYAHQVATGIPSGVQFERHSDYAMSYSVFAHESAHTYHFNMRNRGQFENEWYAAADEGDTAKGQQLYSALVTEADQQGYSVQWKEGKPYFFGLLETKQGPSDGFINPYGSKNILEDVATYVQTIADSGTVPHFQEEKVYSKVYLLCKYDFISKSHKVCKSWSW